MLLEDDLKSRAVCDPNAFELGSMTDAPVQKEKEDLEEISNELELADEDEKVP